MRVGVLRMAFRARTVFGTFEKQAPGVVTLPNTSDKYGTLSDRLQNHDSTSAYHLPQLAEQIDQGPVSQKSRNFSGLFRVPQFPLYLRNAEVLSHQTSKFSYFFLH